MNKGPFTIEFYYPKRKGVEVLPSSSNKFVAEIAVISKSFRLYEVSKIKKFTEAEIVNIASRYIITGYQIDKEQQGKWKDAATFRTNSFVETLGRAIDQKLYEDDTNHLQSSVPAPAIAFYSFN